MIERSHLHPVADGTLSKAADAVRVATYASAQPTEIDLALAGNPLGHSPRIDLEIEWRAVASQIGYRDGCYPHTYLPLVQKIISHYGIDRSPSHGNQTDDTMDPDVYLGAGCTGIIQEIFNSGLISSGDYLVVPETTFPVPAGYAAQNLIRVNKVSLTNDLRIDFAQMTRAVETTIEGGYNPSMLFFANPNNPTGHAESTSSIIEIARKFPDSLVVVSEANIDYISQAALKRIGGSLLDPQNIPNLPKNLIVLRSFSKAYGIPEDRIGFAVGDRALLRAIRHKSPPFNIPSRSIVNAMIALDDQAHVERSNRHMTRETAKIAMRLKELGFPDVTKSDSNLLVAKVPLYFSGSDELDELLREQGCSVIPCGPEFGRQLAGNYIRISPSTAQKNDRFLEILADICRKQEHAYLGTPQSVVRLPRSLNEVFSGLTRNSSVSRPPAAPPANIQVPPGAAIACG